MRNLSKKEIESVLKLDGPHRFEYFIKHVVDEEQAWGLWSDGWALMDDADKLSVFPLWPALEYAQRCAIGQWADYQPRNIALVSLLDELAPKLKNKGIQVGAFPTPDGKGVKLGSEELCRALRDEMRKYE